MLRPNRVTQAIERNPDKLWARLAAHVPGAAHERRNGVTLTSFTYPHPLFNFASLAECDNLDAAIEGAREFYAQRGLPWVWVTGPSDGPSDLRDRLLQAGFEHSHDTPGMAIDLHAYSGRGDVREVNDRGGLCRWLDSLFESFGMDPAASTFFLSFHDSTGFRHQPVRYFYIEEDGKPVALSMLHYGAGVAGIYCVGTLPAYRRRGLGERVMHGCLSAAVEDGYDTAILHSSRMGLPLYEKLGFKEYCKLGYFTPPA